LSRRLSQAFTEEWKISGGHIAKEILYKDDPAVLGDLPATEGNLVFLAADAETAHLIRPYLNVSLPVYATSQLFNGNADTLTNYDLHDVRFIDMPWLLQPDHPAVMIYPRPNPPLEPDMERLYALGIDAFRLLQIMISSSYRTSLPLDGVTGRIRLNGHQQFQREGIQAQFWHGLGLTPEEIAAQEAALAAAKISEASSVPPAATPTDAP
jgi:outer membrane PBP1 activator LpoA protein